MITKFDLDAIWLEGEPHASEAFERLVRDHGRCFAEMARDWILACKQVSANEMAIAAGLKPQRIGKH